MARSSGNDDDKENEQPRPDDQRSLVGKVFETAQSFVQSAETVLLLHAAVSAAEQDTALAVIYTARAVLHLAHTAWLVVENRPR